MGPLLRHAVLLSHQPPLREARCPPERWGDREGPASNLQGPECERSGKQVLTPSGLQFLSRFRSLFLLRIWAFIVVIKVNEGFPHSSVSKESACNTRDPGSIPGWGRSPGGGNGQPTPVLLPGESHGQRSLAGYSLWVARVRPRLSD